MNPRCFITILFLSLVSCTGTGKTNFPPIQTEIVTPFVTPSQVKATEVVLTPPTAIMPSPSIEETSTPTYTPIPAVLQTSIPQPAAIIAKVEGGMNSFILVGESQNGSWVNAADVAGVLTIDSEYQLYTAFEFQDWFTGQGVVYEPICDQHFITFDPFSISQSAVGVSGEWSVLPRTPLEISTDSEFYLKAVAAWLVEQAPSQPIVVINKIWQVDVEGDGINEVFINATHFTEPSGHNVEPRDYSVVLMRTVIGSDVVTVKLVGDYYPEAGENRFPLTYNLEFIGDLNADGQMEVVVGVSRWEGTGVMVFEIDGEEVQLVLSVMCSQ